MQSTAKRIWACVQLVAFILLAVLALPVFRTELDTSRQFTVCNFSNTIWAENPTDIYFTTSKNNLEYLYTTFILNSESAEGSTLTVRLSTAQGQELFCRQLHGSELADGRIVNLSPPQGVKKGQQLVLALHSDAATEEAGFRIQIGPQMLGDITHWTYSGITDTQLMPELHIVYRHFGVKTLLVYLALAVLALAATLLPGHKYLPRARGWLAAALFLAAPLVAWVLCQACGLGLGALYPGRVLTNYLLILALQLVLLAISANTAVAIGGAFTALTIFSLVNHYTLLFRGVAVSFADVRVIGAAMEVAARYNFTVDMPVLFVIAITLCVLSFACRWSARLRLRPALLRHTLPLVAGAVLAVVCAGPLGQKLNGGTYSVFDANSTARDMGQVYSFVCGIVKGKLEKPADYDADALLAQTEQYMAADTAGNITPDIVLIMNETLTDLGSKTHLDTNIDPLAYLHTLAADDDPRTFVGQVAVPSFGASTANTEFEAITGLSMRNFAAGSYPFAQYISNTTPSLGTYLQALGYQTSFLHPGAPKAYNRMNVYRQLQFDTVRFEPDFVHREDMQRGLIGDKSCYDEVLQILDDADTPQFIFNLTIQNHGGWSDVYPHTVTLNSTDQFNPFKTLLSLYHNSDQAFEYFISQLEQREQPTLVVMFGDHLPALDSEVLAYLHLDEVYRDNPLSQYTTPVVIWANYDVDLADIPSCFSTNYLPTVLAKAAGLPLSGQQQFMQQLLQTMPVYSPAGCYDANLQPVEPGEAGRLYQHIQYAFLRDITALPEGFALPVTE